MQRRSKGSDNLLQLNNQELARVERTNNKAKKKKSNYTTMGDIFDAEANAAAQANEIQNLQQQLQHVLQNQQQQQQQQRAIGDVDTPHTFYQNRAAICPPAITRQDYEIKPQLIALVRNHLFHGLPAENPMDHIENLEELCSTTKANGVPPDYLKCKLFPFSLSDKAQRWLKSFPAGSLTSWEECRAAFLDHFYTKSKTASLRNKITTFQQHSRDSFCEAWERFKEYRRECPHHGYSDEQIFDHCKESIEEIEELFSKARSTPPPLRQLLKVEDPEKFVVSCSIKGVEFEHSLCDYGSSVHLMSKDIAEKLGLADLKPPQMTLKFANSSTTTPYGTILDLLVKVGNCVVPTDFQVVEMSKNSDMPLILGRPFMATVGAIVDMPNKRISFSNITKMVFYKAIPTSETTNHVSCITVVTGDMLAVVSQKKPCDKSEVDEVIGGIPHMITKVTSKEARVHEKVKSKRIKGDPKVTLIPQSCDGNTIEYKVKCKGVSKPFSKFRAVLTSEMKEKGKAAVKGLMSRVLKLKMSECGACFETSSDAQPD